MRVHPAHIWQCHKLDDRRAQYKQPSWMFTRKSPARTKLPNHNFPRAEAERSSSDAALMQRKGDEEKGSIAPRDNSGREQRLFSSVTPGTMRHTPGSTFGSAALVAGTTVGAGAILLYLLPLCPVS